MAEEKGFVGAGQRGREVLGAGGAILKFEAECMREAAEFAAAGGMALVGWFRDSGGRFASYRLMGYDRSALVARARRFGVGYPLLIEAVGIVCPYIELWGEPLRKALRAVAQEGAS